ncbi:MAG: hypothetical protein IJL62_05180 [Clostridia bacterium]|nr:hypothetical protein [Clostridia bacterium]
MNLKEAFRYQNKLQSLMADALHILRSDENVTKTETTYLRHKVNPEVQDEKVVEEPGTEYFDRITEITRFLMYLLGEKEKLAAAIRKAKSTLDIDMDNEVSLNAVRQSLTEAFRRMCDLRGSEKVIPNGGSGLRFNAEGNQITYKCDVKRVTLINFDRNTVRKELQKLGKKADEISAKIDLCMVTSCVEYEPPFNVNESFATAFEQFTEEAGN